MMTLFLILVAVHFIADYPLQTEAIALGKNRNIDPARFGVDWWYWLTAHSATHAMPVGIVVFGFTGNAPLAASVGVCEFAAHWLIDYGKCEKWYGLHVDQAMHVLCKLAWVAVILFGV